MGIQKKSPLTQEKAPKKNKPVATKQLPAHLHFSCK
jgi:hypothetical protein